MRPTVQKAEWPIVSVVIPCLNRAHYLVPTLESVLDQDNPDIECIVVDGGSSDGTLEILKRYGDRIRWVSEPDEGHADAINKGWGMSHGEILAWLNADDLWVVPDAVTQAVGFLEANPDVDLVYGDCGSVDAQGEMTGMSHCREWDLVHAVTKCDHCIPQPAAFIRRSILEKVGWLDTRFVSKKDHELWLRIGLTGTIRHLPFLLAHARSGPGYMAQRGDVTAAACVALTRKFFTLPGVPAALGRQKRKALGNAYLRGMDYAWGDGHHWRTVLRYALASTSSDPRNAVPVFRRLTRFAVQAVEEGEGSMMMVMALTLVNGLRRTLADLRARTRAHRRRVRSYSGVIRNLMGDRDVEWSWVAAEMPSGPGEALDFGPGASNLGLLAAQKGFSVTAIDLEPVRWAYRHPRLRFVRGDLLRFPLSRAHYDLVICCSTVEHVGLTGRYGVAETVPDGDLEALARIHEIMRPGGRMIMTLPVGRDAVFGSICRVYGEERLPRLLNGFEVERAAYWVKDAENRWAESTKEEALAFEPWCGSQDPLRNSHALGCFVLRRPSEG